jgi:hypothetical protein
MQIIYDKGDKVVVKETGVAGVVTNVVTPWPNRCLVVSLDAGGLHSFSPGQLRPNVDVGLLTGELGQIHRVFVGMPGTLSNEPTNELLDLAALYNQVLHLEDDSDFEVVWVETAEELEAAIRAANSDDGDADVRTYAVVVGNVGHVYDGPDAVEAARVFDGYVEGSKSGVGRSGNESVTLFQDREISRQYQPPDDFDRVSAWFTSQKEENVHGEVPEYPRSDWEREVGEHDTNLGYWEWAWSSFERDYGSGVEDEPQARKLIARAKGGGG